MNIVRLREGKERSLLRRHPWVFAGSIAKGGADTGETVRVESHDGRFLGWAAFSPRSAIRLRLWSFDEAEAVDAAFFARRVAQSVERRVRLGIAAHSDALRLVHGEADGLPGLIVDRYRDTLVAQFLSAGAERWRAVIADALLQATGAPRLYERSDASARGLEGLGARSGWLRGGGGGAGAAGAGAGSGAGAGAAGAGHGAAADDGTALTITEHGWRLAVDVAHGHKTGYYLDQRDNRRHFADWVRRLGCARVLNCYCYTGGFSVAALAGGARQVTSVDSSAPALAQARANVETNLATNGAACVAANVAANVEADVEASGVAGAAAASAVAAEEFRYVDADVNAFLRQALRDGERYDAIVLDPPKFAPSAAHADRAARAYKDINRLALKLLAPGGLLFTFSCSGGVGAELFHKIVAGAGHDAGVDAAIVQRLEAGCDHPTTLEFPEGEYLKGLALVRR